MIYRCGTRTHQLLVRERSRLPSLCNQRRHVLVEDVRQPRCRLLRVDLFGRCGVFRVRGDIRPRSYEGEKHGRYPEDGEAGPGARRIDVDWVEVGGEQRPEVAVCVERKGEEKRGVEVGDELAAQGRGGPEGQQQQGDEEGVRLAWIQDCSKIYTSEGPHSRRRHRRQTLPVPSSSTDPASTGRDGPCFSSPSYASSEYPCPRPRPHSRTLPSSAVRPGW